MQNSILHQTFEESRLVAISPVKISILQSNPYSTPKPYSTPNVLTRVPSDDDAASLLILNTLQNMGELTPMVTSLYYIPIHSRSMMLDTRL
jgi:hypothetical protein